MRYAQAVGLPRRGFFLFLLLVLRVLTGSLAWEEVLAAVAHPARAVPVVYKDTGVK